MMDRFASRLPVDMVATWYSPLNVVSNLILSQDHSTTSNRPANAFRRVTVTEFRESTTISTRFSTLRAVRFLSRPGLVAALARKHNTRAGSSSVGTKENPFALANFARNSQRTTSIEAIQTRTGVREARHRPAGERERRPPVSLLCFDTQLFAGARPKYRHSVG